MPRLPLSLLSRRTTHLQTRTFSTTLPALKGSQNSTPGWSGRPTDDHVVNRTDKNDIQSDSSQTAMQDKKDGKEGSGAISQKDEGKNAQKAKDEFPEAPDGPVLGMNDERGGKGH